MKGVRVKWKIENKCILLYRTRNKRHMIVEKVEHTLVKFGYDVIDKTGTTNQLLNGCDFLGYNAYYLVSIHNMLASSPSNITLFVNLIVLFRLTIKNHLDMERIVSKETNGKKERHKGNTEIYAKRVTGVHLVKLTTYWISMVFMIAICFFGYKTPLLNFSIYLVLFLSYSDTLLGIIERLFRAEPKPLLPG